MRRLIKLPPNGLFRLAYKLWKGYAIKNRIHPYTPSMREFMQTVRLSWPNILIRSRNVTQSCAGRKHSSVRRSADQDGYFGYLSDYAESGEGCLC
jgi:hypothetical protein